MVSSFPRLGLMHIIFPCLEWTVYHPVFEIPSWNVEHVLGTPFSGEDTLPTTVVKQLFQCRHCRLRFICKASRASRRWFDPRTIQPKEGKIATSSQDNKIKLNATESHIVLPDHQITSIVRNTIVVSDYCQGLASRI